MKFHHHLTKFTSFKSFKLNWSVKIKKGETCTSIKGNICVIPPYRFPPRLAMSSVDEQLVYCQNHPHQKKKTSVCSKRVSRTVEKKTKYKYWYTGKNMCKLAVPRILKPTKYYYVFNSFTDISYRGETIFTCVTVTENTSNSLWNDTFFFHHLHLYQLRPRNRSFPLRDRLLVVIYMCHLHKD